MYTVRTHQLGKKAKWFLVIAFLYMLGFWISRFWWDPPKSCLAQSIDGVIYGGIFFYIAWAVWVRSYRHAGVVVDEEGKPLHGVTLKIVRYKNISSAPAGREAIEESPLSPVIIDGSFNIHVPGSLPTSSFSISFEKEGYRSEECYYSNNEKVQEHTQPGGRVRVVLRKKGELETGE